MNWTAVNIFQDQVRHLIVCLAGIEEPRDVWMIEVREDLHLGAKASTHQITAKTSLDKFDCDLLPVLFIVARGEINATHSAVTDLTHNAVRTNPSSDYRWIVSI